MNKAYRHGDFCLIKIDKLPKLEATKTNILLNNGSGGHDHTFTGGTFYAKKEGDFLLGYFEAKNTKLFHPEHSPDGAEIEDGVYEARHQVEFTHDCMKEVID